MQRIDIIKYIEGKENKDIFQDYNEIHILLDGQKYSHKPLYWMIKVPFKDYYLENIYLKKIISKFQIFNRIQYIKQSGYKFSCYNIVEDTLTIVFE